MKAEVLAEVKKEVEKMIEVGFIKPCRYTEWILSVVPVLRMYGFTPNDLTQFWLLNLGLY
jgi:hypothetical protein